jgi:hypothetical protein
MCTKLDSEQTNASSRTSQATLVRIAEVLEPFLKTVDRHAYLYAHDFPDWFCAHTESQYGSDWLKILVELRSAGFFYPGYSDERINITREYLSRAEAVHLGKLFIERLAAVASTLPNSKHLINSLELDGYAVDKEGLELVPMAGVTNVQAEESLLTKLVRDSRVPNAEILLKHIGDAQNLFVDGKAHPSLNESRTAIQTLVDAISEETGRVGGHATKLPGGTANRCTYLKQVDFLTEEEENGFRLAWGMLCAGSHPRKGRSKDRIDSRARTESTTPPKVLELAGQRLQTLHLVPYLMWDR